MILRGKTVIPLMIFLLAPSLALATTVENIENLILDATRLEWEEGEVIEENIILTINAPFDVNTMLEASLGDNIAKRNLVDLFDEVEIEYVEEGEVFTASNPTPAKNIVFSAAGKQYVYLKLPEDAEIESVSDFDIAIHGRQYENIYPKAPAFDVGDDGTHEWEVLGDFDGFGSFITSDGLDSGAGGSALIKNKEEYFCEVIDIPATKDVKIFAKYNYASANTDEEGDMKAIILSSTDEGASIKAQGGANICDLPEPGNTTPDNNGYFNCEISLNAFITGEKLMCVFNDESGSGTETRYNLNHDTGQGEVDAYRCDALRNGESDCTRQGRDFFIKVQVGEYSGYLVEQMSFSDGQTEHFIDDAITDLLGSDECSHVGDAECIVPIAITSEGKGIIYIDSLRITYTLGGTQFTENNFYEVETSGGAITEVEGFDLTEDVETNVTVSIKGLSLIAPLLPSTKSQDNYTLEVDLVPGPSDEREITIVKKYSTIEDITVRNLGGVIDSYKKILSIIVSQYPALLSALDMKSEMDAAIADLSSLKSQFTTLNGSSASDEDILAEKKSIKNKVIVAIEDQPRSIIKKKVVSDKVVISPEDVSDSVVLENQRDDESKRLIYQVQEKSNIKAAAELYEILYFDGSSDKGTIITKNIINAPSETSNGYIVEVIPSNIASNVNGISFESQPEVIQQGDPIVVRWQKSSAGNQISYVIEKDILSSLGLLKTILVPRQISAAKQTGQLFGSVCGDGVCDVLEIGGEVIPLEDRYTCPVDCKKPLPVTSGIIALIIIIAAVYYFNFYNGPWNWDEVVRKFELDKLLGGKKKTESKTLGAVKKSLFISRDDEDNVKKYVDSAMKKGFNKQKISGALLAKGWTNEQVEYALKNVKK